MHKISNENTVLHSLLRGIEVNYSTHHSFVNHDIAATNNTRFVVKIPSTGTYQYFSNAKAYRPLRGVFRHLPEKKKRKLPFFLMSIFYHQILNMMILLQ